MAFSNRRIFCGSTASVTGITVPALVGGIGAPLDLEYFTCGRIAVDDGTTSKGDKAVFVGDCRVIAVARFALIRSVGRVAQALVIDPVATNTGVEVHGSFAPIVNVGERWERTVADLTDRLVRVGAGHVVDIGFGRPEARPVAAVSVAAADRQGCAGAGRAVRRQLIVGHR